MINDGRLNRLIYCGIETDEGYKNSGEVLTEPGLTLTVAEVLNRYTHGKALPDGYEHNRQYSESILPNMAKGFDLCDLPRVQRELSQQIADANAKLEELKKISTAQQEVEVVENAENLPKEND